MRVIKVIAGRKKNNDYEHFEISVFGPYNIVSFERQISSSTKSLNIIMIII